MSSLEYLAAFSNADGDKNPPKGFNIIRYINRSAITEAKDAHVLLDKMTTSSSLAELRAETDSLHAAFTDAESGDPNLQHAQSAAGRIQRAFKSWLSAFKSFDDRTSAWLSKLVGKEDDAYTEFKRLLSEAYDTNFAYRLCCGLRNASEHAGNVINDLGFGVASDPQTGDPRKELTVRFDGPKLAEAFPKMKASIRHELRAVGLPMEVEWIVGSVILSCERVHAGLFQALWKRIDAAIALVENYHQEALNVGGEWATFISRPSEPLTVVQMDIVWNPWHVAQLARLNHDQTVAIMASPTHVQTWRDFAADA